MCVKMSLLRPFFCGYLHKGQPPEAKDMMASLQACNELVNQLQPIRYQNTLLTLGK